jgi:hypothetical protein
MPAGGAVTAYFSEEEAVVGRAWPSNSLSIVFFADPAIAADAEGGAGGVMIESFVAGLLYLEAGAELFIEIIAC